MSGDHPSTPEKVVRLQDVLDIVEGGDWWRDCECSECRAEITGHGMSQDASEAALLRAVQALGGQHDG